VRYYKEKVAIKGSVIWGHSVGLALRVTGRWSVTKSTSTSSCIIHRSKDQTL